MNKLEILKSTMASIFQQQKILKEVSPDFSWSGLGNLLGDFGEAVAIEAFELEKAPSGSSGFDAITKDGKTVQIKANRASSTIGLRGEADLLLVLSILDDATFETLYFGEFKSVRDVCNYSARDNKWTVPTATLKKLGAKNKNET